MYSMERLVSNWRMLQPTKIDSLESLGDGMYVVVLHADKIPPHIGVIYQSEFYSLKVHTIDYKLPITYLNEVIHRRNIATLCYEVCVDEYIMNNRITEVFSNYSNGLCRNQTCLAPLNELFDVEENCDVVMDLLNYLAKKELVRMLFGLHLPENYQGIPFYTLDQVYSRISQLKK